METLGISIAPDATTQRRTKPQEALLKQKRETELQKIRDQAAIDYARERFCSDDLEIDDKPETSRAEDDGTWVAAWLYVRDYEIEDKVDEAKAKHRLFKSQK